jgi:acetolactate synthase-1/2/3 large subunit
VLLTGDVASRQAGLYTHQVFDHLGLARPVTKYAAMLNPARAAQQMAKALDIALAYPAGPVLLNIPADQARAPATQSGPVPMPPRRGAAGLDAQASAEMLAALDRARRPLALIGRGALVPSVVQPLRDFLDRHAMPFFTSYKINLRQVADADLLVLIGFDPIELRDAWLDAWPAERAVLSLDWGPLDHRMFPTGLECHGDLAVTLARLTPAEPVRRDGHAARARHRAAVAEVIRPRDPVGAISPAALFHAVNSRITEDWWLTVDVGAHRILASHVIQCLTPGQMLQSNGLCCMGYAVPAAIGAQLVHPDQPVVALVGDGCLLMSLGDLALAAELDLPLIVIVLNDNALSLIKLKQKKAQLAPQAVDFRAPDFAAVARGMGAEGVRVDNQAAFEAAFDAALTARRFTVIEAMVDPGEYLEQM